MINELKEVERLRELLTDPRDRISVPARQDLERLRSSPYVSVQYVAACTLGSHNGTLPTLLEDAIPQFVRGARDACEGRKTPDEIHVFVEDIGELFRASRSHRLLGILGAIAGSPQIDEVVRKEAERYALGYANTF